MAEFARSYGIGESQLFNWLKRETPPLPKHWSKLADFFAVSTEYLISGAATKVEYPDSEERRNKAEGMLNEAASESLSHVPAGYLDAIGRVMFDQLMRAAAGDSDRLARIIRGLHEIQDSVPWKAIPSRDSVHALAALVASGKLEKTSAEEDLAKAVEQVRAEEKAAERKQESHRMRSSKTQSGAGR